MLMKWEKAHNKKISEQKFGYCNLWYTIGRTCRTCKHSVNVAVNVNTVVWF